MTRIFQRTFRLVTSSWHMYFVGFLFGLIYYPNRVLGCCKVFPLQQPNAISAYMMLPVLPPMRWWIPLDNFTACKLYG